MHGGLAFDSGLPMWQGAAQHGQRHSREGRFFNFQWRLLTDGEG
jgi:hypothetical protein